MQGLEAGAADLVDGHGGHGLGQSGLDGRLAGRILAGAGCQHLTEQDFIHLVGGHACAGENVLDDVGAQVAGGNAGERAAEGADGGAACGDDHHF
ncbi:hypothetical protein A8U91_02673 [Halomonas elongata]|uniref:Uncharacterized protein n=1 Tax=Halomonas elongata TaxID=2746 RepID=A0A1B8P7R6_HALEL|nr:hypothetical protein A8U91_02673 [Halomonas elongata]